MKTLLLGILISGGQYSYTSVEVFIPTTGQSCELPSLPHQMYDHTMHDKTICGGYYTPTTCITFSSGQWVTTHILVDNRWGHISWGSTGRDTMLLGGGYTLASTETVTLGQYPSKLGFTMQHNTK